MLAERELLPFLDFKLVCDCKSLEEIVYHAECLGVSYDNSLWILFNEMLEVSGVVGLHVLNDKIVRLAVTQYLSHIAEPLVCEIAVNCIKNSDLVVNYHI